MQRKMACPVVDRMEEGPEDLQDAARENQLMVKRVAVAAGDNDDNDNNNGNDNDDSSNATESTTPTTTRTMTNNNKRNNKARHFCRAVFLILLVALVVVGVVMPNVLWEKFQSPSSSPPWWLPPPLRPSPDSPEPPFTIAPQTKTKERYLLEEGDSLISVDMHSNGTLLAVGSGRYPFPIRIVDMSQNWTEHNYTTLVGSNAAGAGSTENAKSERYTEAVKFCPLASFPYIASVDRSYRLNWFSYNMDNDDKTGQHLGEFQKHKDIVRDVSFHPFLPIFATASDDKTVKLWNFESGMPTVVATTSCSNAKVRAVLFRPDGKELAIGSGDGSLSIINTVDIGTDWQGSDPESPQCPARVLKATVKVGPALFALAYRLDHQVLAAAGAAEKTGSSTIFLYDTTDWSLQEEKKLVGHSDRINFLAWGNGGGGSDEKDLLWSASSDGTVLQWNTAMPPPYKPKRLVGKKQGLEEAFGVVMSPQTDSVFIASRDESGGALRERPIANNDDPDQDDEDEDVDDDDDDNDDNDWLDDDDRVGEQ